MNKELLLLNKKHTNALIEKKTKPQEKIEFKMKKQMEIFSISYPIYLSEEGKGLLAVTFLKQRTPF